MRIALFVLALLVAACGAPQPPLVASEVEITRPVPGRHMSAGFLVLTNNTDEDIRITVIASGGASRARSSAPSRCTKRPSMTASPECVR